MNRYFALAYGAGAFAVYVMLAAMANVDLGMHAPPYVFTWWHPAIAAFVGSVGTIAPAIYLGRRVPEECLDCTRTERRLMRVEKERDDLKQALLALEPPK